MCKFQRKISENFPKKTLLVQQKEGKERKGKMQRKKNKQKHKIGRQKYIYINNNKCR